MKSSIPIDTDPKLNSKSNKSIDQLQKLCKDQEYKSHSSNKL